MPSRLLPARRGSRPLTKWQGLCAALSFPGASRALGAGVLGSLGATFRILPYVTVYSTLQVQTGCDILANWNVLCPRCFNVLQFVG